MVDYFNPGKYYFDSRRHNIRAAHIQVVGYYNPGKKYFDSSRHDRIVVPIHVVDYDRHDKRHAIRVAPIQVVDYYSPCKVSFGSRRHNIRLIKQLFYVFSYCTLRICTFKTCNKDISEAIIANSFKHGQLIKDDW